MRWFEVLSAVHNVDVDAAWKFVPKTEINPATQEISPHSEIGWVYRHGDPGNGSQAE